MSNSIGGGLETSIVMNSSGFTAGVNEVKSGTDVIDNSLDRMTASMAAAGADTASFTSSLKNAAAMVELLSAKTLAASAAAGRSGAVRNKNTLIEGMSGAGREQAFQQSVTDRMNQFMQRPSEARERAQSESQERLVSGMSAAGSLQAEKAAFTARMTEYTAWVRQQEQTAAEQRAEARVQAESAARSLLVSGMSAAGSLQAEKAAFTARMTEYTAWVRQQEQTAAEQRAEARVQAESAARSLLVSGMSAAGVLQAEKAAFTARMNEYTAWVRQQEQTADERARAEQTARQAANAARHLNRSAAATGSVDPATLAARTLGRENLEAAEASILRMQGALNPMVAMEHRLAVEAQQFAAWMQQAQRSGAVMPEQAAALTAQFAQQQVLLMNNAQQQQQGFLGMRRMGFAAQQFGYAIEDAASVYGTMGMAGAFRAAGNNLTAVGALMGPQVGVMTSLAAAAVSLGINLYEAKKKAAELVEETKKLDDLRSRITENERLQVRMASDLMESRTANHERIMEMYEQQRDKLLEINEAEQARLNTETQLVDLLKKQADLRETNRKIAEEDSKWWQDQFAWSIAAWNYAKDAGSGLLSLTLSEESARLAEERFNQETFATIEMNRQEALLKRANSEEQKRLELMQAQFELLKQGAVRAGIESKTDGWNIGGSRLGDVIKRNRAYAGEYDVRDANTMHVRQGFGEYSGDRKNLLTSRVGDDLGLQAAQQRLRLHEQLALQELQATTDLHSQKMLQEALVGISKERLRVDQMRVDLNKAGEQANRDINNSIMGRFESLNEELRIENEIERIHKATQEQNDLAVRSGQITVRQAENWHQDMEDVLAFEQERRDIAKEIEIQQKEEGRLLNAAQNALQPATVAAGLTANSDEGRAFLENERLRAMAQNDAEPVVQELRRVRDELKRLREASERIAQQRPQTAAML